MLEHPKKRGGRGGKFIRNAHCGHHIFPSFRARAVALDESSFRVARSWNSAWLNRQSSERRELLLAE